MLIALSSADDLRDDELVKNSAIASTIGLVDMAAQAGKLLDYSAHARVVYRHHAGVCID